MAVWLTEVNLALTALVFLGFGLWGLLAPHTMIGNLGLSFADASGATSIRAMYGGFLIGAGLLFGFAAVIPTAHSVGLGAIAIIVGAILASRVVGLIVDGALSRTQLTYAAIEVASLALTALCFVLNSWST